MSSLKETKQSKGEVRFATVDDIPSIVAIGKELHHMAVGLEDVPFNLQDATDFAFSLLLDPNSILIVATIDNKVVGGIAGFVGPMCFNKSWLVARETQMLVVKEHRGPISNALIKGFFHVAKQKGAKRAYLSALANNDLTRIQKLYSRKGLRLTDGLFIKEL